MLSFSGVFIRHFENIRLGNRSLPRETIRDSSHRRPHAGRLPTIVNRKRFSQHIGRAFFEVEAQLVRLNVPSELPDLDHQQFFGDLGEYHRPDPGAGWTLRTLSLLSRLSR